uniref:Translation initiation factor IF2/IF5 domain-containing protein n=1 Tax=Chromera velia CCMP2878 TaxID=1169474 RepID=A0A0G4H3Y9_9ALVE|eukprot:Cvel_5658.t1-p1 / transcript=Cvel_5658.t1 / gene=Cvel_5658 / organism=Chromera_velia_CCMP2878 / gene_product=Eukaryotic translation initiation factor 2 subunit, putative / transcript_product=Eukaryotic translation initiation factor 2 subunit, putative / location=Cvel_scaffold267:44180-44845(+) / protein_length=222 / sequence_SO=supercontig / SO=protein_coding / is_pseudo=false
MSGAEKETEVPPREVPPLEGAETFDFGLKKKKKGRRKKKEAEEKNGEAEIDGAFSEFRRGPIYAYEELLQRVRQKIKDQNGDLAGKKKITLRPPNIERLGPRVVWTNFAELCQMIDRSPEPLLHFVLVELGTEGSIAGCQVILRGRYTGRQIESLLRQYIHEYVACQMCHSSSPTLEKDQSTRLQVIKCSDCGAFRTVAAIKAGYHAQTRADRKKAKEASGG